MVILINFLVFFSAKEPLPLQNKMLLGSEWLAMQAVLPWPGKLGGDCTQDRLHHRVPGLSSGQNRFGGITW